MMQASNRMSFMFAQTVHAVLVLLALCAMEAGAQSFETSYTSLAAKNPREGVFTLHLTTAPRFHEGERIPVDLEFRAPAQSRYTFAGVLLDPAPGCGDLRSPCYTVDMHTFSKMDPVLSLGFSKGTVHAELNGYVPRLKPGRYQAALLARRLVQKGSAPLSSTWGYAEPAQYLVSGRIEFTVIPATPAWVRETLAKAVAVLDSPQGNERGAFERRMTAARRLRYLQHPLAWEASIEHLGPEPGSNDLLFGLFESPRSAAVCALMQKRVSHPAQYVTSYYLRYLADICLRARPDYDPKAWNERVRAERAELMDGAARSLAASLRAKQRGVTKGTAIYALLEYTQSLQNDGGGHPVPLPGWLPELRREAVASYFDLPAYLQAGLVGGGYWRYLRGPEMVGLIKTILAAKITDYNAEQNWNQALFRLHDIAPAEARQMLLAELRNPDTRIEEATLDLLPPESVPNMDDALIETLAGAQRHPAGNARMAMIMIARYASPRVLKRIKAIFESQQNPCQPELMAYFLRTDPEYADAVFHRHPWDMHGPAPCAFEYFTRTPKLRMHKVLEKYLSAYLMHEDVRLKQAAAEALGRYGSPAAEEPLWAAFRYFHEYWKDRRNEVAPMSANEMLECSLRNAIARARNWLVREPNLRLIESLCITERCLWETQSDLQQTKAPFCAMVYANDPSSFRASLAQYTLTSLADLKAKLAQYPKGTPYELMWDGRKSVQQTPNLPELE
jgi:hypothetical protein